jgi:hypothetical protein
MAIRIERNADATIAASAVAGGTLTASTTYYVCCVFGRTTAWRDGDPHSDFTNEVSVATTAVNRSIQITYTWAVNITQFSDAGGGQVRVKCDELHCLLNTNTVTIAGTTNYNGVYSVYYDVADVDGTDTPDSFRINATWVSDDATGTVTCADNVIGSNNNISVRVSTTPLYVGGEPDPTNILVLGWIGPGYSAPAAVQNYTVTSQPTGTGAYARYYMPFFQSSSRPKGITRHDRPYFEITTYEAWDDIVAAMETWLPDNTNYIDTEVTLAETLYFLGSIKWQSLTSLLQITRVDFTLNGGNYAPAPTTVQTYLKWLWCFYKQIGIRRPQISGTFQDCMIRSECADGPYMDDVLIQDCMIMPTSNYTFYGTGSAQLDGATIQFNDDNRYFWYVYPDAEIPQTRVKNLIVRKGYFYIYSPYENAIISSDTHYMENIDIYADSTTRDIYIYQPTGDRQIEVLNVRAPLQTNGKCRVLRHSSYPENDDIYFYFSVALKVTDKDGVAISGATVTMTDKDSNEVSDTTDVNGEVTINVKSYQNLATVGDEYGTYTDFNPFVLTVEKGGYQTYTEGDMDFYDKIDKTVALQPAGGTVLFGSTIYGSTIY